jgi:hypothetical protein
MPRRNRHRDNNEDEDVDVYFDHHPLDDVVSNRKITFTLKPHPVKSTLSRKYFDMLKMTDEELKCSICLDNIDCKCCFVLYTCGHYYHLSCVDQLQKPMCSLCGI